MVVWLTGLSGSGKSTISDSLVPKLRVKIGPFVHIDGDVVREVFGNDLGYDIASREIQIGRIQSLAKIISDQDINVLVAALYSNPKILNWNRTHFKSYFEIYVDAPLEILVKRDTKGIYNKLLNGSQNNIVGFDLPWTPPQSPDLIIKSAEENVATSVKRICDLIF